MYKKIWFIFLTTILIVATFQLIEAASLQLTLNVEEEYSLGEIVSVLGTLTQDGLPITDGLVTIQINDPHERLFILRTLPTGDIPSGPWAVEILQLVTCDKFGNSKSSFTPGEGIGMNITVRNNGLTQENVTVTLNLYYSNGIPFTALELFQTVIPAKQDESRFIWPIPIPEDATTGPAFAYANALDGWPKNNGFAYCPEKSTAFTIGSGGSQDFNGTSAPGEFNLTFRTNPNGGFTGNYSVSAVSLPPRYIASHTTFGVILIGDVNGDGKVRVDDVLAVALAFGSNEGDPDWDPRCDLNKDGKVRVDDVLIVALAFGSSSG